MPVKRIGIFTKDAPTPVGPYSQAIRAGNFVFISGQVAIDPATGEFMKGSVTEQTQRCMENIRAILTASGGSLQDVVRITIYLAKIGDYGEVNEVYGDFFDLDPPARATFQVGALPLGAAIEIAAIAYLPE